MSKPASERKPSKFDILENAKKIRNVVLGLLVRDFGIKNRTRNPEFYKRVYEMTDEDGQEFIAILEKYGIDNAIDKYPEWYINSLRDELKLDVFRLIDCIEKANVYPQTIHECDMRRDYQNEAESYLKDIFQWLDMIATSLPCDRNKFLPYLDLINKEIRSIYRWRKSDNKIRRKIEEKNRKDLEELIKSAVTEALSGQGSEETINQLVSAIKQVAEDKGIRVSTGTRIEAPDADTE
jgi:hypothetical protein